MCSIFPAIRSSAELVFYSRLDPVTRIERWKNCILHSVVGMTKFLGLLSMEVGVSVLAAHFIVSVCVLPSHVDTVKTTDNNH